MSCLRCVFRRAARLCGRLLSENICSRLRRLYLARRPVVDEGVANELETPIMVILVHEVDPVGRVSDPDPAGKLGHVPADSRSDEEPPIIPGPHVDGPMPTLQFAELVDPRRHVSDRETERWTSHDTSTPDLMPMR